MLLMLKENAFSVSRARECRHIAIEDRPRVRGILHQHPRSPISHSVEPREGSGPRLGGVLILELPKCEGVTGVRTRKDCDVLRSVGANLIILLNM